MNDGVVNKMSEKLWVVVRVDDDAFVGVVGVYDNVDAARACYADLDYGEIIKVHHYEVQSEYVPEKEESEDA